MKECVCGEIVVNIPTSTNTTKMSDNDCPLWTKSYLYSPLGQSKTMHSSRLRSSWYRKSLKTEILGKYKLKTKSP